MMKFAAGIATLPRAYATLNFAFCSTSRCFEIRTFHDFMKSMRSNELDVEADFLLLSNACRPSRPFLALARCLLLALGVGMLLGFDGLDFSLGPVFCGVVVPV